VNLKSKRSPFEYPNQQNHDPKMAVASNSRLKKPFIFDFCYPYSYRDRPCQIPPPSPGNSRRTSTALWEGRVPKVMSAELCAGSCCFDRKKHTHKHTHKKSARCNLLIVLLLVSANMAHPVASPMHDHAPRANQRANAPCFVVTMRANAFDLLCRR
jgi:hypothetical protein